MRAKLKRYILRLLNEMDGIPMTDDALNNDVKTTYSQAMDSEIKDAKAELESANFISGVRNKITGKITWTLTDSGQHQASQL
jgi:hypothetical protein